MLSDRSIICLLRRLAVIVLCLFMTGIGFFHTAIQAEEKDEETRVVRVGWFDSSFCYFDKFGRRCGIDYEYQHKISAYTGWTYEYVEDSWPNLYQMLCEGKIDLLSDVSYKEERTEFISYPNLPMGTESYYIYVSADNREITMDDLSSFDGKRIGVNKGSVQEGFLKEWAEKNHIQIEIIPMTEDEDDSLQQVTDGLIDGYACIYSFTSAQKVIPIARIGQSDYYYGVNKNRPDLLAELNIALAGIQDDSPYFKERIKEERLYNTRTNAYLTPTQEDWIKKHGTIRIGYRDNFLPFCDSDKTTGELTGALKDYLAHAANNLRNTEIRFEAVPYASSSAALEAVKAGEVDCAFPVYLNSYDSDQMGIRLTDPVMTTEMNAVMRYADNQDLSRDTAIAFAVGEGDFNPITFIMSQYPDSTIKTYPSGQDCYAAVASGDADCFLLSNYRLPPAEETLTKYKLFNLPTGESMPLSFAVKQSDRDLYFLLNKTAVMTKSEDMDSALASYMNLGQKVSFRRFLRDNWFYVLLFMAAVFLLIVVLLFQKMKAERKSYEHQRMVDEAKQREKEQKEKLQSAMDMAYKDPLTGVKSKRAYSEAESAMNKRIQEGTVSEFSVIVFDLNDLKQINDSRGHEVGDAYIKDACRMICSVFKRSPVFRIGGDEFVAILEGEDYENQEELLEKFEKQVLLNIEKDSSVVAFGCSKFNPQKDENIRMVFGRADAMMYKEKMILKSIGKQSKDEKNTAPGFEDISMVSVRRKILIADDVESSREILGDLLKKDYEVIYATDGKEALDLLKKHKDEIAVVLLDLYMPNMTGRELMTKMQVDEDLMSIPVIFLSIDANAELDCLRIGAMDFIPKPYPDIEIIKARISKCIELSENRDLIRSTQRDKLTGLYNIDYFIRYVSRYDQHYKGSSFDAVVCNVNQFQSLMDQYGKQFADLVLRSIGLSLSNLARRIGGIGCRREGDLFLLYCPHQEDYETLLHQFADELFLEQETADKVSLRFGIYAGAERDPDIEDRFICAKIAADSIEHEPERIYAFYTKS